MSQRTITVFSEEADYYQRPGPVAGSILIHGLALGIIVYGVMYNPRIVSSAQRDRYNVRRLDFSTPMVRMRVRSSNDVNGESRSAEASVDIVANRLATMFQAQRPVPEAARGSQTLIQADLRSHVDVPASIHVPTFVIWRPAKQAVKSIVPPPQTSYAAYVTPSISAPNAELELRDIAIAASDLAPRSDQSPAGTTSPVVIHNPAATQKSPVTVSQTANEPTPVAVLSISDSRMIDSASILPPVNETAGTGMRDGGGQMQDRPNKSTLQPTDHPGGNTGQTRSWQASADNSSTHGHGPGGDTTGSSQADAVSSLGSNYSATVITLPKDGHFGAVVVGASLEDRFPEMEGLWSGRLIYTVYLHVGLPQSWVLQYSLPRSAEATAAGNVAHLEAPWPYNIVRPDLPHSSTDADTLIVNGFINQEGRFEKLRPVFPASFSQFDFVLQCLQQWQFRPGTQSGHPTRLEVMLIIPDPEE